MAEYLNDDEQVQALRSWWERNGTALIVALVLSIGGVIGWRWYVDHTAATEEAASAAYRHYVEVRNSATATEADREAALAPLDTEYQGSSYHVFALLFRARDAAMAGDNDEAAQLLAQALDDAKDDALRDVARVRLARVQAAQGSADVALATLQQVRSAGFRSYVAELKGDILLGQGKRDAAREAYQSAAAAADPGTQNPILDMKIIDLATPNAP